MADATVERAIESLGTVPEAAKKLKVSKSLIYMVLRGERQPSDKLLKQLGLTRLKLITKST
jgi:ribosome-binding protein aMBF1 (putative translation factor)